MKIKRYLIPAIVGVFCLMMPILESCRTELCYNHFPVADIALSWEQEWERDYGMSHSSVWDKDFYGFGYDDLRPDLPEWVALVRYSKDGEITNEKYFPAKGGELMINTETDKAFLLYNGDTQFIFFSDLASLSEARASANTRTRAGSISYIMEKHPGVRTVAPPDILYSAYLSEIPDVPIHEKTHVPIKMQPLVYTYVIRYEFEDGIEHVALTRGALAGMAESVYLLDGKTSDDTCIILFEGDVKDYGCEAQVKTFGIPGFPDKYYGRSSESSYDGPYTLNLEVMLKNGKIFEFNFDVSDQLKNQPRGGVITVSGIKIEEEQAKPDPVESGFDVDLSGWGTGIDVDLPVDPDGDVIYPDNK